MEECTDECLERKSRVGRSYRADDRSSITLRKLMYIHTYLYSIFSHIDYTNIHLLYNIFLRSD